MNIKEIDGVKYVTYDEHQKTVILAIQLEREACALICDKEVKEWRWDADVVDVGLAIRARGEK